MGYLDNLFKDIKKGIQTITNGVSNAGNVVQIIPDRLHRHGETLALQLFADAFKGFESGLYGFYGIALVLERELLVQNLELCFYLVHCAFVVGHKGLELEHLVVYLIGRASHKIVGNAVLKYFIFHLVIYL